LAADLFVRKPVETAKNKDLTATGRQRSDGLVEDLDFLTIGDSFGDIGSILHHGQMLDIPYAVCCGHAMVTGKVERRISGNDEEVGTNLMQLAGHFGAQQAGVGFLNKVIHVGQPGKATAEVGAEGGFMRLHFRCEPQRMVRGGNLLVR
jgi:hypothetical protein